MWNIKTILGDCQGYFDRNDDWGKTGDFKDRGRFFSEIFYWCVDGIAPLGFQVAGDQFVFNIPYNSTIK